MGVYHPNNLRQAAAAARKRERNLAHASPLANSSVTRGGIDVASKEGVKIQQVPGGDAGLVVEGLEEVSGELRVTGVVNAIGDINSTGDINAAGGLDISADATLRRNLEVLSGGKITAGSVVIDPSARGGSVKLGSSAEVYGSGSALSLYSGSTGAYITLSATQARINSPGIRAITVTASAVTIDLPTIPRASANNAVVGTVWSNTGGQLFRVVA